MFFPFNVPLPSLGLSQSLFLFCSCCNKCSSHFLRHHKHVLGQDWRWSGVVGDSLDVIGVVGGGVVLYRWRVLGPWHLSHTVPDPHIVQLSVRKYRIKIILLEPHHHPETQNTDAINKNQINKDSECFADLKIQPEMHRYLRLRKTHQNNGVLIHFGLMTIK